MFFNLSYLINKYKMNINGIIHIGGHYAEESTIYEDNGIFNVIWIEGNTSIFKKLNKKISQNSLKGNIALNYIIYDEEKEIDFLFLFLENNQIDLIFLLLIFQAPQF